MDHPVSESCLERFAFGRSTPAENRSLVFHLLKGCSFCSRKLVTLMRGAPGSRVKVTIRRFGKARRLSSKRDVRHKPTIFGHGKWESLASFWKYKRASRRRRLIANASRRRNRQAA